MLAMYLILCRRPAVNCVSEAVSRRSPTGSDVLHVMVCYYACEGKAAQRTSFSSPRQVVCIVFRCQTARKLRAAAQRSGTPSHTARWLRPRFHSRRARTVGEVACMVPVCKIRIGLDCKILATSMLCTELSEQSTDPQDIEQ